jgi:hypothetical protein
MRRESHPRPRFRNQFRYLRLRKPLIPWSEMGREAESLREVIDIWPSLPPHIVHAILALVRTARGRANGPGPAVTHSLGLSKSNTISGNRSPSGAHGNE